MRTQLEAMVGRRETGIPLELVLGWAEFCGLRIPVAEGVFVPAGARNSLRSRRFRASGPGAIVVELCCGSGAISAALAAAHARLEIHAVELDPAAVACARSHLEPAATVYHGDLYEPLPAIVARARRHRRRQRAVRAQRRSRSDAERGS